MFHRHAVAAAIAFACLGHRRTADPVRPSGSTRPTGFGNRRGRERGTPLSQICLRSLALAILCLAHPVPVAIVQAQTGTTLVSNTGQTSEPTLDISNAISQLLRQVHRPADTRSQPWTSIWVRRTSKAAARPWALWQ